MTTNQTIDGVPRELLEDMLNPCADFATHDRLRALLDKTQADIPASVPQGEPVAWRYKKSWEKSGWVTCDKHPTDYGVDDETHTIQALYASPPAPVAVDERAEFDAWVVRRGQVVGYSGWREDFEIWMGRAALNTARPTHASPPPGTEPSGTHHDNDGLDEWRKPQDDQARRAELLESLAKQVYQSWESQPGFVPWVDGGNSTKQDEARQIASRTFELALANQVGDCS